MWRRNTRIGGWCKHMWKGRRRIKHEWGKHMWRGRRRIISGWCRHMWRGRRINGWCKHMWRRNKRRRKTMWWSRGCGWVW
jgi:hypothetical protein